MIAASLVAVTLAGLLVVAVGWAALLGKFPRLRGDNWYRSQRAAAPVLMFGGVAAAAGGMAFLPFALGGQVSNGLVSGVCIGLGGWILATAIVSSVLGRRAAGRPA